MNISAILKQGGVGILATDTLYGIVGRAMDQAAVERIYELKGRDQHKPLIILVPSMEDLRLFGVAMDADMRKALRQYWPGPVSIIVDANDKQFEYLHRGQETLAFRLPENDRLTTLLAETGPLVAPSANPQGKPPASSIEEAREYFGDMVDFYAPGEVSGQASRIVRIHDGEIVRP